MNVIMRNFIVSMVTVVLAGLALWSSEEASGGVNVPWLLLVGFAAGCLVFSFAGRWRRKAMAGSGPAAAPVAKKKGRGR